MNEHEEYFFLSLIETITTLQRQLYTDLNKLNKSIKLFPSL